MSWRALRAYVVSSLLALPAGALAQGAAAVDTPVPAPNHPPTPTATTPDIFDEPPTAAEMQDGALQRGEILRRLGDLRGAVRSYRAAVTMSPEDLRAHEGLRQALAEAQRPQLLPPVLVTLVERYHALGDRERATERLDELVTLAPQHAERGRLEQLLGVGGAPRDASSTPWTTRLRSLLGMVVVLAIAFALSTNRRAIRLPLVLWGLGLQLVFALIILWTPPGRAVFDGARLLVTRILSFTDDGASFLFGKLYQGLAPTATRGPLQLLDGTSGDPLSIGLIFVFHVLPTIIFFGALMSVLYHFGIIQKAVHGIAWVMTRTMGTSGAESLSAAANIFVGQTEAPLVIKPYVGKMTDSELMAVMVGGFATVAGGVLAAYVRFGIDAGHLLAASVMGAPAGLVLAKIMVPETQEPVTKGGKVGDPPRETSNVIDAAASGAADGLRLAANVAAMLMAFISLIALINWLLGLGGVSLREIFGYAFYPLSWCLGVDTNDLLLFGNLLGTKISLNEFVAYVDLGAQASQLSERTITIATYALCGFANFSSIGIQIGGISAIAPERRKDLARLGLRAMIAGAMASMMTASIAGVLI